MANISCLLFSSLLFLSLVSADILGMFDAMSFIFPFLFFLFLFLFFVFFWHFLVLHILGSMVMWLREGKCVNVSVFSNVCLYGVVLNAGSALKKLAALSSPAEKIVLCFSWNFFFFQLCHLFCALIYSIEIFQL